MIFVNYNDFYTTGTWTDTLIGTNGNININPNFVDLVDFVPQAEIQTVPRILGVNYDYNTKERANTTTIGALCLESEDGGGSLPPSTYDYYVSESGSGDGLSESTPMSFSSAQALITSGLTAGKTMAFKGGDTFTSQLNVSNNTGTAQAPITFNSYRTGKSKFDHSIAVTGWTNEGGNIWSKSIGSAVYQVIDSNGKCFRN